MKCPECGHARTRRIKGVPRELKPGVPRYQRTLACPKCTCRFTTAETVLHIHRHGTAVTGENPSAYPAKV